MSNTKHPVILAIETSTNSCSVACSNGSRLLAYSADVGLNIHSKQLLDMVDSALNQAGLQRSELEAIAVTRGPGSFTGLRIGIGVAQGLAFSLGLPMLSVSSLRSMVDPEIFSGRVGHSERLALVAIDARMSEIYWGLYRPINNGVALIGEINLAAPEDLNLALIKQGLDAKEIVRLGNAWSAYPDRFGEEIGQLPILQDPLYPDARILIKHAVQEYQQGLVINASDFEPMYVRNDIAKKSQKALIRSV